MNTKIQFVLTLVIGIIIGGASSFLYFKQVSKNSYQEGFNVAKSRVEKSTFGMMMFQSDHVRNLSGTVTKVDGDRITMHTQAVNPFENESLSDRVITITSNTKISRILPKDYKTLQTEMDAFIKSEKSTKGSLQTPPLSYTATVASIQDIKVGTILDVSASEDIKTSKEFTASEINIK